MNGLRVLNTRPQASAEVLHLAIVDAGGVSIDFPALVIEPTALAWQQRVPSYEHIAQAIFISANAVHYFYAACTQPWASTVQTIAIGQATKSALAHHRVHVDHMPPVADSEHLLQLETLLHIENQSILLVKGEGGLMIIEETLRSRGAHPIPLAVYRRTQPAVLSSRIESLWRDEKVDIIVLSSEQSIHHLMSLWVDDAHTWFCNTPCVVFSERLAHVAHDEGMRFILVTHYDKLLATLKQYQQDREKGSVTFWRPKAITNKD